MESRVDTTLRKQITVELYRIDWASHCAVLKVSGIGKEFPEYVHLSIGNTLTFDIPLEVHIGW